MKAKLTEITVQQFQEALAKYKDSSYSVTDDSRMVKAVMAAPVGTDLTVTATNGKGCHTVQFVKSPDCWTVKRHFRYEPGTTVQDWYVMYNLYQLLHIKNAQITVTKEGQP